MAAGSKERERKREGERGEGVNGGESEREREIYLNVHSKLSKPDSTTVMVHNPIILEGEATETDLPNRFLEHRWEQCPTVKWDEEVGRIFKS